MLLRQFYTLTAILLAMSSAPAIAGTVRFSGSIIQSIPSDVIQQCEQSARYQKRVYCSAPASTQVVMVADSSVSPNTGHDMLEIEETWNNSPE